MVTIYVWDPNVEIMSVGHVSLKVDNTSTYISWYPLNNKKKPGQKTNSNRALPSSYYEDCSQFSKRPADDIFEIQHDIVNASKIEDWWFDRIQSESYHLFDRNCATVVRDALVVGLRHQDDFGLLKMLTPKLVTPIQIRDFCTFIQEKTYWYPWIL